MSQISRRERISVTLLLIASFVLFSLYSVATPLFEASDELWHYPFVQHLATGGGLPIQHKDQTDAESPWRQEGSQPPLYYGLAALASAPFDSSNWREIRRVNIQGDMGVPTRDGNANAILHTQAEAFPWARAALAAHVARLVSILLSTCTVFFVYLIARELSQGMVATAHLTPLTFRLASMIFAGFVPMFAFISGSINNDNAAVMFSSLGLWWALRLVRVRTLTTQNAIIAGLITGLGALSKSSSLGLLGLFGLAAVFAIVDWPRWQDRLMVKVRTLIGWGLILLTVTTLISGWWFVRNVMLYGDLLGWTAFLDVVGRRVPPATLAQLWSEREGFIWAYWGVFGTLNVIMPTWIYYMLNGLAVLALIGLARAIVQNIRRPKAKNHMHFNPAIWLCLFFLALTFGGLIRWTTLTPASQGRLMFPCIAVLAAAMAYGLGRIHRIALWLGCMALMSVAIAAPFVYIAPTYAKPTNGWRERLPIALNANFGGTIELVEASVGPSSITPDSEPIIQFNWRLTAAPPKNYSVFVHLVDQNNVILAQRDMYPGQGSLALSEHPSGFIWSDHYALRVSPLAPPLKTLRWRIGVYDFENGQRLKLPNGNDFVEFGQIQLQHKPNQPNTNIDDNGLLYFDNGVVLQRYEVPQTILRPGEKFTVTVDLVLSPKQRDALQHDDNLSIQLLDNQARKVAQRDLTLPRAELLAANTARSLTLDIAKDAPPGEYKLLMVMYTPDEKKGFPKIGAYDSRKQFMGDQIELTRLRVQ